MKFRVAPLLLCLYCLSPASYAETLICPDLASAVQVGTCPTEDELRYTYKGYCGDNARLYDRGETSPCTDYALYRDLKNISLWESADGRFDGYVSCNPGKAGWRSARALGVKVSKQGSVTRVACHYDSGLVFTHRTKAACVADAANCGTNSGSDSANCKATCD